jgi:hypothetical protein
VDADALELFKMTLLVQIFLNNFKALCYKMLDESLKKTTWVQKLVIC